MSTNLNFFKGKSEDLEKIETKPSSFYLTEDSKDFYFTTNTGELIRIGADPTVTIKEIHTYYSTGDNTPPNSFPPNFNNSGWTEEIPNYYKGEKFYIIECIVYMDGHYEYSEVEEMVTYQEIENICGRFIQIVSQSEGEF